MMMISVPLGMASSLGSPCSSNRKTQVIALWRTLFYLPSIVPAVASSILWVWILKPQSGLLNTMLASLGIAGPNWLQDEHTSKLALIRSWASGAAAAA